MCQLTFLSVDESYLTFLIDVVSWMTQADYPPVDISCRKLTEVYKI